VGVALYAFRLAGFVAFEATGSRGVLLFFPNVFEFWFLFVAAQRHWWRRFAFRRRPTAAVVAVLAAVKVGQEYALHVGKWLDSFTAAEFVDAVVDLFR
jgi:hypothetical protein